MEAKQHYTELAINNARCRGRSRWMYEQTSRYDRFVTAYKDGRLEYIQIGVDGTRVGVINIAVFKP